MNRAGRAAIAVVLPALLACGRPRERDRAVDAARLPRYAACDRDCDRVLLDDLAAAVRARPPLALFRRRDPTRSTAHIQANLRKGTARIRRDGWSARGRPFPVEPPIDWSSDLFRDRNWRFQLSSLEFVPPFLQLHEETGDLQALAFARAVLLDWIDFHLVRRRPDDFAWNDHATGLRATRLAYVLDRSLRRGELGPGELRLLLAAAREHVRQLGDPRLLSSTNHAIFQLAGIAALCTALPELAGCREAHAYAEREFTRIVDSQFTAEGIHTENSPAYQGYALVSIDLVVASGWLHLPAELQARLDLGWRNLPWLIRPDGTYARIGDSSGELGKVQRVLAAAHAEPDPPTHRAFPASGYAIVRAPGGPGPAFDGYLFLTASYNSTSHKHRDALSFEWFDAGAPVLVDAGGYSANRDAGWDYTRSSRAHNTIEVDGGDIDGGPPRAPTLVASARLGDLHALAGEVVHPEIATRHRRVLLYRPGRWLLVHDEVNAEAPRTITTWFHLPADATFRPGADDIGAAELSGVGTLRIVDLTGRASATAVRGQSLPRLEGWVIAGYGELVEADAIGLTQEGTTLTFDTLFLLGAAPSRPARIPGAGLCWTDGATVAGARVAIDGAAMTLSPCGG